LPHFRFLRGGGRVLLRHETPACRLVAAVRVMVNCNQMGQAAGVAAWLALDSGTDVDAVDVNRLRVTLKSQGAIVL